MNDAERWTRVRKGTPIQSNSSMRRGKVWRIREKVFEIRWDDGRTSTQAKSTVYFTCRPRSSGFSIDPAHISAKDERTDMRYEDKMARWERGYFLDLMRASDGKVVAAAAIAGISSQTLRSKLKKHGLYPDDRDRHDREALRRFYAERGIQPWANQEQGR